MDMPNAIWTATYKSDRRKHSHRCRYCRKIIAEGDTVVMARVVGRATRCMHEDCASKPFGGSGLTGRDFLEGWGMQYLAACGFRQAQAFMDVSPVFKAAPIAPAE